jgi:hypothetical protein
VIQKGCCKDSATVSVLSEAFAKKAETGINFLLNIKSVGVLCIFLETVFPDPANEQGKRLRSYLTSGAFSFYILAR